MTAEFGNELPDDYLSNAATDFASRRQREERRQYARKPKKISDVVAQLITARGYGRIQANEDFSAAWRAAVGDALARYTLPGRVKRGQLEITVANSMIVQELTFQKQQIIAQLQAAVPEAKIRDLKLRVGAIN